MSQILGSTTNVALGNDIHEQVLFGLDVAKTIMAATAIGVLHGIFAQAIGYAREGKHLGEPLSQMQSVQWKVADCSTEVSAAELMLYQAAWSKDEAIQEFHKNAAMAKFLTARAARFHSSEALQICGTDGLCADSHLEKLYRDAKMLEVYAGTADDQKTIMTTELKI